LALTAATPFYRGYISDVDCRWDIIAASVDCRRPEERSTIPKSRYDSVDAYLSPENKKYNDVPIIYKKEHLDSLIKGGIDESMAQHIAHLFIRDPVSLFSEKINQDNDKDSDHFENIQSTNWQTMRFKPPPPESPIGWRVEFRPCEVQLTDFENAAVVCFVVLLTRVILSFNLNFMIPISKVDYNMKIAQRKNAILSEKFWFRKDLQNNDKDDVSLMTINEIINGTQGFPGLVPLIQNYLNSMDVDADTQCTLQQYLSLISRRAKGELMTAAKWMRDFVMTHPSYEHDSVVTEEINYDLLKRVAELTNNPASTLLGNLDPSRSKTLDNVPEMFTR